MVYDVRGKFALVTGGATGIGLAYAEELFKNGLKGVVIADIDVKNGNDAVAKLNKTYGANSAVFIKTDVTNNDQFEAAFKLAVSSFGGLNILINNAGVLNDTNWQLEISINCNSVVQGSLLGIKYMGKNNGGKGGVIVNVASILGLQPFDGCPVYAGTKHFVVGLNRSFGQDYYYNLTGIKFLTMCPGVTETPLITEAGKFSFRNFPGLPQVMVDGLKSLPWQSVDNVAKGLITLITKGENGSVWVSEGGEPIYEVELPLRIGSRKE